MKYIKQEINRKQYEKALTRSPYSLIPHKTQIEYGVYDAQISSYNGRYFLIYTIDDNRGGD